ncbi:hypothetical protein CYMTET_13686 [Cymbomonas tetramitiformis]|uniref:Reverse transcriptase domain-containing protein n=1 Tax=Cymbomonas tetramitiformis TaxID=36881 RepID=A0AAE0LAY3_9CHLO|nr:hypothetical protein CYMTET_13686 [Cymbomonas tetramitiformis]
MVVYTTDGMHRMLVLKVPPRKFNGPQQRYEHARRQMTFHDTGDGLYAPGVRYTDERYRHFLPEEAELEKACKEGHRMEFVTKPIRYERDNHPSCYEYADRSEADCLRAAQAGVLEGPLWYEPWSITPLGSLYNTEKDKFRNVWNARASGVNEAMVPASAEYDYIEDVLRLQRPRCLMDGFDLSDAFWNNARYQPHCDYMGVQLPVSKAFYRARYDMFGFTDAPKHQAEVAQVFKRMLNNTVYADGRSECTGVFVDDGHTVHDEELGVEEATSRVEAAHAQLAKAGIRVSEKKTQWPSQVKDYVGREIHSVPQHVGAARPRVEKYVAAANKLLSDYPEGTPVPRQELAAVVGKFQFLAPLVKGGQNMLAPIYRARDDFTDPGARDWSAKAQWGTDGGIAYQDRRHIVDFPAHERAPHKSSNFREASTFASTVELLGPEFAGGRMLGRSDNSTTVSLVNRQGTMASELWPVCERLFRAARLYDLDVAAKHIPGKENDLSDGLSCYVRHKDYSDWQYRRDEFESLGQHTVYPFTLDGGADPVGTNSHLPRFCSVVDSFLRRDLRGEHVYANPDFSVIGEYLRHFLEHYRSSPGDTSGVFVLPVWDTYDWWPLVRGGRVLKYYSRGSHLFTSPEWRHLQQPDGSYAFGSERAFRGPTHWAVVVLYFPPTVPCRRGVTGAQAVGEAGGRGAGRRVPVLSGDAQRDRRLLSGLRPDVLPAMLYGQHSTAA